MNAEKVTKHLLTTSGDVTALVSARIYDTVASQDAQEPFIVFNLDQAEPTPHLTGTTGQERAVLRVTYRGRTVYTVNSLASKIRAALDRQTGTIAGVDVQGIFWQDQSTDEDEGGYVGTQIYNVWTN